MTSVPSPPATTALIETAPADQAAWLQALDARPLPVLAHTAAALEQLRAIEDNVDAHGLAEELGQDPLFVLKLLRFVSWMRRDRATNDIETTTEALVMLGIGPFFREFGVQPEAEQQLSGNPHALVGFNSALQHCHRAARFAMGFAVHRQDTDAMAIFHAALLHDFVELLVWLHAPSLALALADFRTRHPETPGPAAQLKVLNVALAGLQQALMKTWHLPPLLVEISDDEPSENPQVRNVQLAMRIARHSAQGWDHPELEQDVGDAARLLGLAPGPCLALLQDIDA